MRVFAKLNWNLQVSSTNNIDPCDDALEEKRLFTDSGRKSMILLQNNAQSHKAKKTPEIIADLGWEILSYAAYSPNLALLIIYFDLYNITLASINLSQLNRCKKSLDKFIESKLHHFSDLESDNCLRDGKNV